MVQPIGAPPDDGGKEIVLPKAGLLDFLTRSDELAVMSLEAAQQSMLATQQLMALIARTMQRGPTGPAGFGTIAFKQSLLNAEYKPYEVKEFSLTTARTDESITIDGQSVQAWTNGSLGGVGVKLNNKDECGLLYFDNFNPVSNIPFHKIFLTSTAQTGKTLKLMISKEPNAAMMLGDFETTLVQKFWILRSTMASHFYGSIAQNATEEENITGLISNEIRIIGVFILSDQSLNFRVIFFGTDGFADADLSADYFQSEVGLDLPSYGFRIGGTGKYMMSVSGLTVDYEDEDGTGELHVALQNLSATAKNPTTTGEVVLGFIYEERE